MGNLSEEIRRVLERSATGALPLSTIRAELRREGLFMDPEDPRVHATIKEEGETFGIISLPKGPWTSRDGLGREGAGQDEVWLLLQKAQAQAAGPGAKARAMIQEGFRAWASGMDPASTRCVARWMRANLEGARVCRALATGRIQEAEAA